MKKYLSVKSFILNVLNGKMSLLPYYQKIKKQTINKLKINCENKNLFNRPQLKQVKNQKKLNLKLIFNKAMKN